ncbi:MAG: ATP-binding protein [Bacteroides sp.]|nr:ATP-binding protein [Bacteroides sp.]
MGQQRIFPVGIQDFEKLRTKGAIYVDKTDLIFQLVQKDYVFLSRPRRFGKSLLSSTLKYYFQGRKDLFQGLAIEKMEQEWVKYPVLHFDLSTAKNQDLQGIRSELERQLRSYEVTYGCDEQNDSPGQRFAHLIHAAHKQAGKKTVVIIDEYDAPMLDVLHDDERMAEVRKMMQEFYAPLKVCDADLRFVFITGITKFSQLSIFSVINNLTKVSMSPEFSAICGITEEELHTVFEEDIAMLAKEYECTPEEMRSQLKERYDGYHFSGKSADIYNPFSILKAFAQKEIKDYWFESGTPTYLIRQIKHFQTDIPSLDHIEAAAPDFDRPTETMSNVIPLLYQSGYITIRKYDRQWEKYTLGIPNNEIRVGLTENLLPDYAYRDDYKNSSFVMRFCETVYNGDLEKAMVALRAYLAGIPYPEGGKEVLQDMEKSEYYYETIFYLMFSFMNRHVQTQVKTCRGRADMVMYTAKTIYVFELKINKPDQDALDQIDKKGYMVPYTADGRKLVKCGISFSTETRTIEEWMIKEEE